MQIRVDKKKDGSFEIELFKDEWCHDEEDSWQERTVVDSASCSKIEEIPEAVIGLLRSFEFLSVDSDVYFDLQVVNCVER